MALQQLQGLSPLGGGGSGYGTARPAGQGGTEEDPNNPQNQQQPRRPQQQGAPSSSQAPQQGQTFAEMQQQGRARPAPPPAPAPIAAQGAPSTSPPQNFSQQPYAQHAPGGMSFTNSYGGYSQAPQANTGLANQLQQSASQQLSNPSAYGAPQVQATYNMLNQQLGQDYAYQQKQLNEQLASRGISDSTLAGQKYSDLATEQARAQANLATTLSTQAAQQYGQDRTLATQNALGVQGQLAGQGLSQQQLALQQALGYGNLGVSQQQANTQQAGTLGNLQLGQQQLQQQGTQFGQNLALQSALGYGNLGLQAGQLTGNYNGQQTLGAQQLGLQQLQNQQQFGLQQGQLLGNYNGQQTLAGLQNQQQYGLGLQNLAQTQAYQQGQLGLGQQQINASMQNESTQAISNLLYAGLNNGMNFNDPAMSNWLQYITQPNFQGSGSLYNIPGSLPYSGGNPNGGSQNGGLPQYQMPGVPNGTGSGQIPRIGAQTSPNTTSSLNQLLGYVAPNIGMTPRTGISMPTLQANAGSAPSSGFGTATVNVNPAHTYSLGPNNGGGTGAVNADPEGIAYGGAMPANQLNGYDDDGNPVTRNTANDATTTGMTPDQVNEYWAAKFQQAGQTGQILPSGTPSTGVGTNGVNTYDPKVLDAQQQQLAQLALSDPTVAAQLHAPSVGWNSQLSPNDPNYQNWVQQQQLAAARSALQRMGVQS